MVSDDLNNARNRFANCTYVASTLEALLERIRRTGNVLANLGPLVEQVLEFPGGLASYYNLRVHLPADGLGATERQVIELVYFTRT